MTFQTEFPDYPVADMPKLPVHGDFVGTSWHNDACPSIASDALGLRVWIDFADKSVREFEDGPRFIIVREDEGVVFGNAILETDDWDEVLAILEQERLK